MREFIAYGYELFNCPVNYLEKVVMRTLGEVVEVIIPKEAIFIEATSSELAKYI
jgi:hypothetical protein